MGPACSIKEFSFGQVNSEVFMEGIISRWQEVRFWSSEVRSLEVRPESLRQLEGFLQLQNFPQDSQGL